MFKYRHACLILYPYLLIFIHLIVCYFYKWQFIVTLFVYFILGKVYVYPFHLKQGGVIQPGG